MNEQGRELNLSLETEGWRYEVKLRGSKGRQGKGKVGLISLLKHGKTLK